MENKIYTNFTELNRDEQKSALEALIFASNEPMTNDLLEKIFTLQLDKLSNNSANELLGNIEQEEYSPNAKILAADYFEVLIYEINQELAETGRPFTIVKNAGGYLYSTRAEYGELLQNIARYKVKKRLSPAALESLAIIAYKQPITKPEIEQIRGVNSNEVVNSLIDKELVEMVGRKDVLGKPLLYGTTHTFLQIFGLNSLEELPKLREIDEILSDDNKESEGFTLNIEVEEKAEATAAIIPEYESFVEADEAIPENDIENEEENANIEN